MRGSIRPVKRVGWIMVVRMLGMTPASARRCGGPPLYGEKKGCKFFYVVVNSSTTNITMVFIRLKIVFVKKIRGNNC
jgi:hypothetical protein